MTEQAIRLRDNRKTLQPELRCLDPKAEAALKFAIICISAILGFASTAVEADPSNMQRVPVAVLHEGPADYPDGALQRGEHATVIVAIRPGSDGAPTANLIGTSGYTDLDAASREKALAYFVSGQTNGTNIIAVMWLATDPAAPATFNGTPASPTRDAGQPQK